MRLRLALSSPASSAAAWSSRRGGRRRRRRGTSARRRRVFREIHSILPSSGRTSRSGDSHSQRLRPSVGWVKCGSGLIGGLRSEKRFETHAVIIPTQGAPGFLNQNEVAPAPSRHSSAHVLLDTRDRHGEKRRIRQERAVVRPRSFAPPAAFSPSRRIQPSLVNQIRRPVHPSNLSPGVKFPPAPSSPPPRSVQPARHGLHATDHRRRRARRGRAPNQTHRVQSPERVRQPRRVRRHDHLRVASKPRCASSEAATARRRSSCRTHPLASRNRPKSQTDNATEAGGSRCPRGASRRIATRAK